MPISAVLSDLASQEGCDDFEYDVMQMASEYVDDLEQFIANLIKGNTRREAVMVGFIFGVALAAPIFYWIGTNS
jgi:hypothetical protein